MLHQNHSINTSSYKTKAKFLITGLISLLLTACGGGGGGGAGGGGGDTTAPVTTITFPAGGEILTGTFNVTWNTTDENTSTVRIEISSNGGGNYTELAAAETDNGGFNIDTTAGAFASDGSNFRIRITPTDIPSNVGAAIETPDFIIDNTAPEIALDLPSGNVPVGGSAVAISWVTTDANPGTVDIEYTSGNDGVFITEQLDVLDDGNFSWDTTTLNDATDYKIRVTATDALGQSSPRSSSTSLIPFILDNTPPNLTSSSLRFEKPAIDSLKLFPTMKATIGTGAAWAEDTVTNLAADLQVRAFHSPTNNISTAADAIANGTLADTVSGDASSITISNLTDAHSFFWNVLVTDEVGNSVAYTSAQPGDLEVPVTNITFPINGEKLTGNFDITWSTIDDSPGTAKIEISSDGGAYSVLAAADPDDGSFSINTAINIATTTDSSTYRVRITPTDSLNNVGNAVETPEFTIDNTNPNVILEERIGDSIFVSGITAINWQITDLLPVTIEIRLSDNGGASFDQLLESEFTNLSSYNWDTSVLIDGEYQIQVIATDSLGHQSTAKKTSTLIADNTPPVVNDKRLIITNQVNNGLLVEWAASNDGLADLRYTLHFSTENNIDTAANIIANGTPINSGGINTSSQTVANRSGAHNAFWNILVNDKAGNNASYLMQQPSGFVDLTFATDGMFDSREPKSDTDPRVSIIDNAGRLIVAGTQTNQIPILFRYNIDGSTDTTFNSTGNVILNQDGFGLFEAPFGSAKPGVIADLVVDASNNIYITGRLNDDMVVWKINSNGTPNNTFGPISTTNIVYHSNAAGGDGLDVGHAIVINSANELIIAGTSRTASAINQLTAWKLRSDTGALVNSFNNPNGFRGYPSTKSVAVHDAILDQTGNIIIVGSEDVTAPTDLNTIVVKLNNNSNLDVNFSSDGYQKLPSPTSLDTGKNGVNRGKYVTIDSQNRIIVAAEIFINTKNFLGAWRLFNSDGSIDATYGEGVTTGNFGLFKGFSLIDNASGENSSPQGVYVDTQDRVYLLGGKTANDTRLLWRFNQSGSLDNDFFDGSGIRNLADFVPTSPFETASSSAVKALTSNSEGNLFIIERWSFTQNNIARFRVIKMLR